MGKNNRRKTEQPGEEFIHLPAHSTYTEGSPGIIDTHCHILSTYATYFSKYPSSKLLTVHDFIREVYTMSIPPPIVPDDQKGSFKRHKIDAIIDVWCEAPVRKEWKELADSALHAEDRKQNWNGIEYYFVLGVHPHEARLYDDKVEAHILEAMKHPRCVGWGEIGLDYHYNLSPPDVQRSVLTRQLQLAVTLGKPITIHTREADKDIEEILKTMVPREHPIHVHCFTDTVELAKSLLDHFPNLYIGVTGVITYATNQNTAGVIKHLAGTPSSASPRLRIVLETDSPYMIPSNLTQQTLGLKSGQKLPISHSGMIPWTADFVANLAGEGWDVDKVLAISRENARTIYGV